MKRLSYVFVSVLVLVFAGMACGSEGKEPKLRTSATQAPAVEPTTVVRAATAEPTAPPAATTAPQATATTGMPTEAAAPTATEAPPAPAATPESEPTATPEPSGVVAGPGSFVVGEGSQITFTVEEELGRSPVRFDAVISSTGLSGVANLDGSPSEITLDLHSLTSDQDFRDRYIQSRMFPNTPTATVTVENLPDLPQSFLDGEETSGTLEGSLQIGETVAPLTFDVEARHDGAVINVLGRTTFTWDQLGLPKPTARSVVYLADEVRVQVLIIAYAP